jgi:hypothetical protein
LEDHSAESEARVERIGAAQIRGKVLAADLEHVRIPRGKLINTLREAAKRCWPPAQSVYLREREARVANAIAELRSTLDPGIVHGLERIEEPGHADSARLRTWPSMPEYAAGLHSRVRALDALKVEAPNFDSYGREVSDEELSYLIATTTGFLQAIEKLQTEIQRRSEP